MNNQIVMTRKNYLNSLLFLSILVFVAFYFGKLHLSEDNVSVLNVIGVVFIVISLMYLIKDRLIFLEKRWQFYFYRLTIPVSILIAALSLSVSSGFDGSVMSFLAIPIVFLYGLGTAGWSLFFLSSLVLGVFVSLTILTIYCFILSRNKEPTEEFWQS